MTAQPSPETLIYEAVSKAADLVEVKLHFESRRSSPKWEFISIRPVLLKGILHQQFSYRNAKQTIVKNYDLGDVTTELKTCLTERLKSAYIHLKEKEVHISISKKGHAHFTVHRAPNTPHPIVHNIQRPCAMPADTVDNFLVHTGVMTSMGKIREGQRRKHQQINEFVRILAQSLEGRARRGQPLYVVDFGCGNAYLTFGAYHYLHDIVHMRVQLVGIDQRPEPLQRHRTLIDYLGWRDIEFHTSKILDFVPAKIPDVTLALHACDTATDDAIASGIMNGSHSIICVPCCHQHLQSQTKSAGLPEPLLAFQRFGLLNERLCDITTDAFRTLILRICGYKTDVIQFVSGEYTARNIMIRAVNLQGTTAPLTVIAEYEALKRFFNVIPYLETVLGERLARELIRTQAG